MKIFAAKCPQKNSHDPIRASPIPVLPGFPLKTTMPQDWLFSQSLRQ
jgi:hypothetical protein